MDSATPESARRKAYADIQKACQRLKATLTAVPFKKLDFGETSALETFYNADVVIVDISTRIIQALAYHVGVRHSMGMKHNIIISCETDPEITSPFKLYWGNSYKFLPYQVDSNGTCVVVDPARGQQLDTQVVNNADPLPTLWSSIQNILLEMEKDNKTHLKERFLKELKKIRTNNEGENLAKALYRLQLRLDDPQLLSPDVIWNMLISYRDIQDYNAMVKLVEGLSQVPNNRITNMPNIQHLYAFALNRRDNKGDSDKALSVIKEAIAQSETPVSDMLCLCGRIFKDKFVQSECTDKESLAQAIEWYRKGFDTQPNEYAGINLATLLVISGETMESCQELKKIGFTLNHLIGRKGCLDALTDYWDVATLFEMSVLVGNYPKALQAAKCMFTLNPPNWYLKSTIGNIKLISKFRKSDAEESHYSKSDILLFHFWTDFFVEAIEEEVTVIRFPCLVLEPTRVHMPSYIQVNTNDEQKNIHLWNVTDQDDQKANDWTFPVDTIKKVSLYKRDSRAIFLYVEENSDDFHIYFSSTVQANGFYKLVSEMIADDCNPSEAEESDGSLEYEYDYDDKNRKIVLGRGSYGVVYAARNKKTQVRIAIKEVPEKNLEEVQPLHEEIKLHSHLSHKNIVKYLGSVSEDGFFKIFMEQVPGGSLSQLLQSKWGPLKDAEKTIVYYTKQILEGLKYLHDNKIVHRDIKGDNVLVNTYSGVLKISDFGTSKRLSGINPNANTLAGTMQYMAPEVIDKGVRGYGPPADIWSFGCTVVEMATGKLPFTELGLPQAAMFKVGYYKIHPAIPESMSESAKSFIMRCFVAEAEKRASCAELIKHPFLSLTKSKGKRNQAEVLNRSTSVQTAKESSKNKFQDRLKCPPSTSMENLRDAENTDELSPSYSRSKSVGFMPSQSVQSARSSSPCTPDTIRDEPLGSQSSYTSNVGSNKFYLLCKDSERRETLVHIFTTDRKKILEKWFSCLEREVPDTKLTIEHLDLLLTGLREQIHSPHTKEPITKAVDELNKQLEFDATALAETQRALYVLQEAANACLKSHNIQPHWMFALDNLLRCSIESAIQILAPELAANMAGTQEETPLVSATSLSSSYKSNQFPFHGATAALETLQQAKEENQKLLQQLVDVIQSYNQIITEWIKDKKLQSDHFKALSNSDTESCPSLDSPELVDEQLVNWLKECPVDEETIKLIIYEQYTFSDFVEFVTLEELQSLHIKRGVVYRIWRALKTLRSKPPQTSQSKSQTKNSSKSEHFDDSSEHEAHVSL